MTSRERVLQTLDHKEPDRIPLFAPNVMQTREPYPDKTEQFLNSFPFDDYSRLGGLLNPPGERRELSSDIFEDAYGCRFEYKGVGLPYCIYSPLAEAETVADIDAFAWPDPEALSPLAEDAREKAKAVHAEAQCATALSVSHIFHRYHYMRGFEQWMIDVKLHPEIHEAIADHIYHINSSMLMRQLEDMGDYTDIICGGDDFGTSTAPYMSPEDFRKLIKPYYMELIGRIKKRFPHSKFYLHSHGQIMDLVPDLIECGVDLLNPILPLDNMDPARLKSQFGDQLCFEGGIDIERILPFGSVDEVRDHVKRVIDILAPGGGYWFKAQVISPIIPPENLIAAYELALEYGRY